MLLALSKNSRRLSSQNKSSELVLATVGRLGSCNAAQLHAALYSQHRLKISYQAVHRLLQSLCEQGVLLVKHKTYCVDRSWLLSAKSTIDQLLSPLLASESFAGAEFCEKFQREQFWYFELPTLFEADCFWGEVVLELCANPDYGLLPGPYYAVDKYAWWMPINLGRETGLWTVLKARGFQVSMLLEQGNKLNTWSRRYYEQSGVRVLRAKGLPEESYFNMLGDVVISAQYSSEAQRLIRQLLRGNPTPKQLRFEFIMALAHAKAPVRLCVQRNRALAQSLRERFFGA